MPILYVVAGALLITAALRGIRHARTDRRKRRPHTAVQVAALVAAGATALTVAVQLTVEPSAGLKAIMSTGAISGGFVTVVFGLWLNDRRIRLDEARHRGEQSQLELERMRLNLEQERSEIERRREQRELEEVADAGLARAIELLGADDARVRSGALHALAALAVHRSDRAQEVVDLVCMYLRNSDGPDPAARDAQRVLLRVVKQGNLAGREDLEVDLSGARLDGLVLGHVIVRALNLSDAVLTGVTSLHDLRLAAGNFGKTQLHRVSLDRAVFDGEVWLQGARLRKLSAVGAKFARGLSMTGAVVEQEVVLDDSRIAGDADFSDAEFGTLTCKATRFQRDIVCRGLRLRTAADFLQAHLRRADFHGVDWRVRTNLDEAYFLETLHLPPRWALPEVSLRRTRLGAEVEVAHLPAGWSTDERDGIRYLVAHPL